MKPEFITFTGIDNWTELHDIHVLALKYPVEFGILCSPTRQGTDPRYPDGDALSRFMWSKLRMSAHLCGDYSRRIMAGESIVETIQVDLGYFARIQVNHADPAPAKIIQFRSGWGNMRAIAQTRGDTFPTDTSVDWLFDRSGGTGAAPTAWPMHPGGDRLVGYAGGISPDNITGVMTVLEQMPGRYWIDMESGVRTDDRFDIAKCRAVCEAVFGK
ncbi:phosphoribosylanthranilate isomerase [Bradyrhizobium sp. 41S5]|uniref:phosphoribosylanthranilate isomerase n=1 Tax=Bradyrhizobium sp. 41S5 TaxID=1404443 RepID=UPI00156A8A18|nr:phosphoribosylanthranilate isomerase [Bradyrhizobium sp. 41S5]UFX42147.1 phosphoribosylanthranilate isomerase [Bradyrhizobium sp. 41S5]